MSRSQAIGLRLALWVVEQLVPHSLMGGELAQIRREMTDILEEERQQFLSDARDRKAARLNEQEEAA